MWWESVSGSYSLAYARFYFLTFMRMAYVVGDVVPGMMGPASYRVDRDFSLPGDEPDVSFIGLILFGVGGVIV